MTAGILIFLLLLGGISAIFVFLPKPTLNKQVKTETVVTLQSTVTPTTIPSPTQIIPTQLLTTTPDSTANWKTYSDTKLGYSFKYPQALSFLKSEANQKPKALSGVYLSYPESDGFLNIEIFDRENLSPLNWWRTYILSSYADKKENDFKLEYAIFGNHTFFRPYPKDGSKQGNSYLINSGKYIFIIDSTLSEQEQILSTFKFTN